MGADESEPGSRRASRACLVASATAARPRVTARYLPPLIVLIVGVLGAIMAMCHVPAVAGWLAADDVLVNMALCAVAVGAFAAIACGVLGHLFDEPRGLWLSVGLTVYSFFGIPAATMGAHAPFGEAPFGNVRLVAHVVLVASSFAAVFSAAHPRRDGITVLGIVALTVAAAGGLGGLFPEQSIAVTTNQWVRGTIAALWVASGVAVTIAARSARSSWQLWAGLGCTVIAVAHVVRVAAGSPTEPLGVSFSVLRLAGVVLVFGGVMFATRRALAESIQVRMAQLAELTDIRSGLEDAAQRDHEVRNSLNVLTSATALLNSEQRDHQDRVALQEAVTDELARLNILVRPRAAGERGRVAGDYDVASVLRHRVALCASTGMDVRVAHIDPRIRAVGDPWVVAQVFTNVLMNCARHAPGSPVRISASLRGRTVVVRVRDFGPGAPEGQEANIFACGFRGENSGGQGFGLYLSRRLIEGESGRISVKTGPAPALGCTVVIEVPAAPTETRSTEVQPARSAFAAPNRDDHGRFTMARAVSLAGHESGIDHCV